MLVPELYFPHCGHVFCRNNINIYWTHCFMWQVSSITVHNLNCAESSVTPEKQCMGVFYWIKLCIQHHTGHLGWQTDRPGPLLLYFFLDEAIFFTAPPQRVKIEPCTSFSITLSSCFPQGCVLSLPLYSLYTYDCSPPHLSNSIIKFADDTTVLGLISEGGWNNIQR